VRVRRLPPRMGVFFPRRSFIVTKTSPSPLRDFARVARDRVRDGHRHLVFNRAMHAFLREPQAAAADEDLLADLVYGWGNEAWSGAPELLQCCIQQALVSRGPVLECGSGLTTLLVGAVVQQTGSQLWSLEHLPEWADRVAVYLQKFSIDAVHLCVAPLADLGDYQWYSPPLEAKSVRFGLVVCDGPPSSTEGGRYGLLPVMCRSLAQGCVILLDDAEREDEQAIVRRWCREMRCSCTRVGVRKPFFQLVVGGEGLDRVAAKQFDGERA
jgi:hypothetical protein